MRILGIFLSVVLCIFNISYGAKKTITIAGSTTVLPIAQKCAEAYMDVNPQVNISIRGGGSGVGISALISKTVDIANSSRPIKDKELNTARQKGVNPYGTIIALDGIAIVVNPQNPINEISLKTLKDIYTGKITNWRALGGPDQEIVVISRDVASGTFEVFKEKVLGGEKVRDDALMLASNKAVATTVKDTRGAIGYIGLGYISEDVKVLKVDGVIPNAETVRKGKYKIARPLYMYTNGTPKGIVKDFIDFILSPTGQKLITDVGFISLQ
ncbi:MAG: phosphate ABC transporter substrate-binding protein [candidate division WOR-3 bacterium]|nr:phosphate ABC transporter substrate-binding protein [candidate division WOR-3 bacterium]MCX7757171.1 phosphate ABC transporter substrate-binding protein [candidate division WOR-3 bacterium]MDW7987982.1 phosphate ABC transporter substrate-binding protein [candidate division WOR-3 bacterium]